MASIVCGWSPVLRLLECGGYQTPRRGVLEGSPAAVRRSRFPRPAECGAGSVTFTDCISMFPACFLRDRFVFFVFFF